MLSLNLPGIAVSFSKLWRKANGSKVSSIMNFRLSAARVMNVVSEPKIE